MMMMREFWRLTWPGPAHAIMQRLAIPAAIRVLPRAIPLGHYGQASGPSRHCPLCGGSFVDSNEALSTSSFILLAHQSAARAFLPDDGRTILLDIVQRKESSCDSRLA